MMDYKDICKKIKEQEDCEFVKIQEKNFDLGTENILYFFDDLSKKIQKPIMILEKDKSEENNDRRDACWYEGVVLELFTGFNEYYKVKSVGSIELETNSGDMLRIKNGCIQVGIFGINNDEDLKSNKISYGKWFQISRVNFSGENYLNVELEEDLELEFEEIEEYAFKFFKDIMETETEETCYIEGERELFVIDGIPEETGKSGLEVLKNRYGATIFFKSEKEFWESEFGINSMWPKILKEGE